MNNKLIPIGKIDSEIANAIARALFVCAYANFKEEIGENIGAGENWYSHAPATPPQAILDAYRLIGAFEQLNGASLIAIFNQACVSNSVDLHAVPKSFAEDYGMCLAMTSLGHGVSWEDNYKGYTMSGNKIQYPYKEEGDYGFSYPGNELVA